jgi:hypothetical protein
MTTKAGVDGSRPSEAALLEQGNRMSDTGGYEEVKAKDIESHGEAGSGTDVESLATMNQVRRALVDSMAQCRWALCCLL